MKVAEAGTVNRNCKKKLLRAMRRLEEVRFNLEVKITLNDYLSLKMEIGPI